MYVDVLQGSDIVLPMFTGWPLGKDEEVANISEVSAVLPKSMLSNPGKCGIGRSEKHERRRREGRQDNLDLISKQHQYSYISSYNKRSNWYKDIIPGTFTMGGQVFDSNLHVLLCHRHQCQCYAAFSLCDPGSCWGNDNVQDLQHRRGSVSQERYDNSYEKTRGVPEDTCSRYFSAPEGIRGNETRQSVIHF